MNALFFFVWLRVEWSAMKPEVRALIKQAGLRRSTVEHAAMLPDGDLELDRRSDSGKRLDRSTRRYIRVSIPTPLGTVVRGLLGCPIRQLSLHAFVKDGLSSQDGCFAH
jgi:hypothetical protein